MPSTSPYQNNDYQAQTVYRPYKLPVNDIFKANAAIDQFWDEGALRVKNVYDNALNLKLSLAPNREIRDQFMQAAEKQIVRLSSMNLADPSIQRQGLGVFTPLLKDQGIVTDNAATLHIDKVNSDAMHFRDTKDGKAYSIYNHQYALLGANEFKNSKDRMAGSKYLERAKDYEPYFDYSAEAANILKNCHPNQISTESESGLNIVSYSDKGLSSAKLNGCLGAGLSEKAKRQLQIEGAVTYNNNLPALRDAYLPSLQNSNRQLSEENAAYAGILQNRDKLPAMTESQLQSIGLTRDTKANPGLTDVKSVTPESLDALEQRKNANQLQINNLTGTISKLLNNDFSPIFGQNFESVASHVYTKGWMDNFSNANAFINKTNTIKGNPSQMLIYKENRTDLRQEDQQTFLKDMEDKKIEAERQLQLMKNKNGGLFQMSPQELDAARVMNSSFDNQDVASSSAYDKITEERNKITSDRVETNGRFLPMLRSMGMTEDVVSDRDFHTNSQTFQNWYNNFGKTLPPEDPKWQQIRQYEDKMNGLTMKNDILKNNQDAIDRDLMKTSPDLFDRTRIQKVKPVTVDGIVITPNMVQDALEGKPSPLGIIRGDSGVNSSSSAGVPLNSGYSPATYLLNGKPIEETTYGGKNHGLHEMIMKIDEKNGTRTEELNKRRDELAKTKTIVQKEGYVLPELDFFDPKNPNTFKGRIMKNLGLTDEDEKAFTVGQTDLKGNIEVTIHPPTSAHPDYDPKDLLKSFEQKYQTTGLIMPLHGDKYHFILSGFPELDKAASSEMRSADYIAPYIRSLESRVLPKNPESTGLIRSTRVDKQYEMKISAGIEPGVFDYQIQDEKGNIVGIYNDRTMALQKFAATINNYKK